MPEVLLTQTQVAEHLGLSLVTIGRWLRSGRLPGIKVGREWRIRESDLDAWISARPMPRVKATEDEGKEGTT